MFNDEKKINNKNNVIYKKMLKFPFKLTKMIMIMMIVIFMTLMMMIEEDEGKKWKE